MNDEDVPLWRVNIWRQLAVRNVLQRETFSMLVDNYMQVATKSMALEKEVSVLKVEAVALKEAAARGDPTVAAKNSVLEEKLQRLQEELTESYRAKAASAQSILDSNTQSQEARQEAMKLAEEKDSAVRLMEESQAELKTVTSALSERDVTIGVLRDELQALQVELVRSEESRKKLSNENESLVKRWMARMNQEVEALNVSNEAETQKVLRSHKAGKLPPAINNPDLLKVDEPRSASSASSASHGAPSGASLLSAIGVSTLPRKAKRKLQGHRGEINSIKFSNNGNLFATGSIDKTVRVWDAHSGSVRSVLHGPVQSIMSVSFSPDDSLLLGTSNDSSMRLWSVATGRVRHVLTGHTGKVYSGSFLSDLRHVVSGGHDRALKFWDLNKGPDGAVVYSGHFDNKIRIWDRRSGECVAELSGAHSGQITSVSVSSDGSTLLSNSRDNTLRVFDTHALRSLTTLKHDSYKNSLNWNRATLSPDARYAAAGSSDGSLVIWSTDSGKAQFCSDKEHRGAISCVDWSGSGVVASADKDRTIVLWE